MKELQTILSSQFKITRIILYGPTVVNDTAMIEIELLLQESITVLLYFENVTRIFTNPSYNLLNAESRTITLEDMKFAQWEGVRYKVEIDEDAMSFYCSKVKYSQIESI